MRVVVAPDKFKGTASARAAAGAIAEGVLDVEPSAEITVRPLADGGEGTAEVLLDARGGTRRPRRVSGPLGRPVDAHLVRLEDGTVIVESAAASGLHLLPTSERDALGATSYGTGELLVAGLIDGPEVARVIVAVGGTASTDGGVGAAAATGWSFLDARGEPLGPGGRALHRLARIEPPAERVLPAALELIAACDVASPLLGAHGSARVFGPQKGASPEEVEILEQGLENLAARIEEDLGIAVAEAPHAGAGGGMGAGLVAFFGASLHSGFDLIAREIGLATLLRDADLVISGEGRLDEQSLVGKCTGGVARMCAAAGVPCVVLAGEVALDPEALARAGFSRAVGLVDLYGRAAALARTGDLLRRAVPLVIRDALR